MRRIWKLFRQLSGEDSYERYLAHCRKTHPESEPLSRKAFFERETERKWSGIKRCC